MNLSHPHTAVAPSLDSEVLVVLAGTTRPLKGREISRLAGRGSWSGIYDALQRLVAQGIVEQQEAAPVTLYTLTREHVAAPAIDVLANLRRELERRITDDIAAWTIAPFHASLFGSAARGDGGIASDTDIFIVRPTKVRDDEPVWCSQLDALAGRIHRWSGNRGNIAEIGQRDLARLRREQPPIVANLRADAVTLFGGSPGELLASRR